MSFNTESTTRVNSPDTGKKKILVIDDRARDTHLVKLCLEMTNRYEVMEENDPNAAIRTAERYHPDLILLDVMMPGKDGGALAAAFHANPRLYNVPIVFLTALVTKEEIDAGVGSSSEHPYLSKPIIPTELFSCLEHELEKSAR
jgi:two-component system OmpR family response regulator